MADLVFGSGDSEIRMSDELEQIARIAVEQLAPGLLGEFERIAEEVLADALLEWPRGTGPGVRSADQFEIVSAITPKSVSVKIRNKTDYFFYIQEKRGRAVIAVGGRGRNVFQELIRGPAFRAVDDNARELAKVTARVLVKV